MTSSESSDAEYLLTRLKEIGVNHLFVVPGDFVLDFFNHVLSDVKYGGICNELNAVYTGRLDCAESLRSAGRSIARTNQLD